MAASNCAVEPPRVLLLVPARTYRAADFLAAAGRMGLDLVVGSDGALPLGGHPVARVSPGDPAGSADRIMALGRRFDAVVAADAPMLTLAAVLAERMGLPHNPVDAVIAAADKAEQRRRWSGATVAQPVFRIVPAGAPEDALRRAAAEAGFPCVVKAVSLSASQGVLRADGPAAAVAAARRIRRILAVARRPAHEPLLVEQYVPGPELSIDGLLTERGLTVTAIFDKPCPPDGPTFEETMLITPSRLPRPVPRRAAHRPARRASPAGHARSGGAVHRRPVLTRAALRPRYEPGGTRASRRPRRSDRGRPRRRPAVGRAHAARTPQRCAARRCGPR